MSHSPPFPIKMRNVLLSIAVLTVLLISGVFTTSAVYAKSSQSTNTLFPSAAPTYLGSAGNFLSGPYLVSSVFGNSTAQAVSSSAGNLPFGDTPSLAEDNSPKPDTANIALVHPTVDCSAACNAVGSGSSGATTNLFGLNAVNSYDAYGYNIEPPDQGLCANNQYVVETTNIGVLQVFDPTSLGPVSSVVSLDNLFGLPSQGASGWGSGGDIMCTFDYSSGGHWFITEFISTTPEPESPFTGCFAAVYDTCREGIAVSVTNNPMGAYNVYFLDPNKVNNDPGVGYLLNDYVKIATTSDALMLFYDEFNQNSDTFPPTGFGASGFNGAQEFAFSKSSLEHGLSAASVNVAYENMGTATNIYPIPESLTFQPFPADCTIGICWYQVIPAQTPDPSQYDNTSGGTGFMVASLDYLGLGDNRIAVFQWTGLTNLDGHGRVLFGGQLLTGQTIYIDEGQSCLASSGSDIIPSTYCGLGQQKAGPTPLGDNCVAHMLASVPCPENGIATNGDGTTQASFANGNLWTAVATQIVQNLGGSSETHLGAAYFEISTQKTAYSITSQGFVTAPHEDMEFPSVAATDSGSALMSFTLSGPHYYPSSAYTWLTGGSSIIHITALGKSPQDGFTEYQGYSATYGSLTTRPRWGDYGQAVFVPSLGSAHGGTVYFASEYIQSPNCASYNFPLHGLACHGTRTASANWGTSLNSVASN